MHPSDSLPDPGPKKFNKISGRRMLVVQEGVELHQVAASENHQRVMADLAARAVRYFAEQPLEIEWHTLRFEVLRSPLYPAETLAVYRWSVWAS